MDGDGLHATFLRDGTLYSDNLDGLLTRMQSEQSNLDLVHKAFRYVHSLKSEAGQLGYDRFVHTANKMEEILEASRAQSTVPAAGDISSISRLNHEFKTLLAALKRGKNIEHDGEKSPNNTTEAAPSPENEAEIIKRQGELLRETGFRSFERQLIREARERGDSLYRLEISIDSDAPLKQLKAYLVQNNLELLCTVIKTIPNMYPLIDQREDYVRLQMYLSYSGDIKNLIRAVEVDQVTLSGLWELDSNSLVPKKPEAEEPADTVHGAEIPEMPSYVLTEREMSHTADYLEILSGALRKSPRTTELGGDIKNLVLGWPDYLDRVRRIDYSDALNILGSQIGEIARKQGKKVSFKIGGEKFRGDRRIYEQLMLPLVHLIRNAVTHGIESPEERIHKGKPEEGRVELLISSGDGRILLEVKDDGQGIDSNKVLDRGKKMGLAATEINENLLSILTSPGFSTADEVTDFAGRGVGLDFVARRIREIPGCTFFYHSTVDSGTSFIIEAPDLTLETLLLLRLKNRTLAVPSRCVHRYRGISFSDLSEDSRGKLWEKELRVLSPAKKPSEEGILIELEVLDKVFGLYCDEILVEEDVLLDALRPLELGTPLAFPLHLKNEEDKVYYLSPAYLYINAGK